MLDGKAVYSDARLCDEIERLRCELRGTNEVIAALGGSTTKSGPAGGAPAATLVDPVPPAVGGTPA